MELEKLSSREQLASNEKSEQSVHARKVISFNEAVISLKDSLRRREIKGIIDEMSAIVGADLSYMTNSVVESAKRRETEVIDTSCPFEDLPESHNAKIRWRLAQLAIESGLFTYDPIPEISRFSTYYFEYPEGFEVPSLGAHVSVDLKLDIPEDGAAEEAIFYISVFPNEGASISAREVYSFVRRFLGLAPEVDFVYVYLADYGYTAVVQNFIEDSDTNEGMVKKCIQSLRESVTGVSPSERKT